MSLRRRLQSLWTDVQYNPVTDWWWQRKLDGLPWKSHAWITADPREFGVLALTKVGTHTGYDDFEKSVRWATCAVLDPEAVSVALRIVKGWIEFGVPEPFAADGYDVHKAAAILREAQGRLEVIAH